MEYRPLGRSGLKVSPLCLGTMMFGGRDRRADSRRASSAAAREAGVNFIDTADVYKAASEEIVGRAIAAPRTTGCWRPRSPTRWARGRTAAACRASGCMQAAEASLRRLGTDYIDIYYLHKEDHGTPLDETVRAMADLIRAGKIRYFGVSNYRAWRIAEICRLCDELGIDRPVVSQPYYNALNRMPEVEHLPACALLRSRRRALQPARARRADRQVPARRRAAPRTPAPAATTSA